MSLNWIFLIVGGLFETAFAFSLNKMGESAGKEFVFWLISFLVCVATSMGLLYLSMKGKNGIDMGTAYAIWAGIGASGAVVAGIILFNEPISFWQIVFLITLIGSIVGLKLAH